MSLNWNISNCKNWESLKEDGEWYKTEHMIFATMAIDMYEITEDNVAEFYARLLVVGKISGGNWYSAGIGWDYVTLEDVRKRIGLHTNANRNTFNQWLTRMVKVHPEFSKDEMLAIYYTAKVEATKTINAEMVGA